MVDEAEANARTTPVPEERPRYAFDEGDSVALELNSAGEKWKSWKSVLQTLDRTLRLLTTAVFQIFSVAFIFFKVKMFSY